MISTWPIPELPPTKRATGRYDGLDAALAERRAEKEGIPGVVTE